MILEYVVGGVLVIIVLIVTIVFALIIREAYTGGTPLEFRDPDPSEQIDGGVSLATPDGEADLRIPFPPPDAHVEQHRDFAALTVMGKLAASGEVRRYARRRAEDYVTRWNPPNARVWTRD